MAESSAHKFGQSIGLILESVIQGELEKFCDEHGLYLDHQHKDRPARRGCKKVSWEDSYGNSHDLDFVIERNGTDESKGEPIAFVEVAWRRYTKHSRNKAQEIQGAILPLAGKHQWSNPFLGAVLAGEFTEGALEQLRSLNFHVLYFSYDSIVDAFAAGGLNIRFDESTAEKDFKKCQMMIERASQQVLDGIKNCLISKNQEQIQVFFQELKLRLGRQVSRVIVIPLYGKVNEFFSVEHAVAFLEQHCVAETATTFRQYEISVHFSNGDKVEARFDSKRRVLDFLTFVVK